MCTKLVRRKTYITDTNCLKNIHQQNKTTQTATLSKIKKSEWQMIDQSFCCGVCSLGWCLVCAVPFINYIIKIYGKQQFISFVSLELKPKQKKNIAWSQSFIYNRIIKKGKKSKYGVCSHRGRHDQIPSWISILLSFY